MSKYLESTEYIDWTSSNVLAQARILADASNSTEDIARRCFEFVRDDIKHSWDFKLNPLTCKASDVLNYGTGYCYAKSHLLAALLRANNIEAGLCYQRLTITDNPPFCLHGLNAIYLEPFGWFRLDARGNKEGISTDFSPPVESLAFPIVTAGEANFPEIWAEPLPVVIEALKRNRTVQELANNLPDIELVTSNKSKNLTPTARTSRCARRPF